MKKALQIICLGTVLFVAVDTFRLFDVFVNFLLVGAVPFADTTLPPSMMLAIFTTVGIFVGLEILRGDNAPVRKYLRQRGSKSVPDFTKPL